MRFDIKKDMIEATERDKCREMKEERRGQSVRDQRMDEREDPEIPLLGTFRCKVSGPPVCGCPHGT